MAKILVTGGGGYIGSHTIVELLNQGYEVISIDNHLNSFTATFEGIEKITGKSVKNYAIDLKDAAAVDEVFAENLDLVAVINFAALIYVNESVTEPIKYFENNLYSLLNVMTSMERHGVKHLIFSSSCSVYGNTEELPVTEATPFGHAESPYARTKQIGEQMIVDVANSGKGMNAVILRYFNPAGAHPTAIIGERPLHHNTHLIPVITEVATGKREKIKVFGTDYETRDGSCIRDYVHVMDLASAHERAVRFLLEDKNESPIEIFNLGIGDGVSVLEAIEAFEKVNQLAINVERTDRRAGDVAAIYANNDKALNVLGWTPKYNIEDIMKSAWDWQQQLDALAVTEG